MAELAAAGAVGPRWSQLTETGGRTLDEAGFDALYEASFRRLVGQVYAMCGNLAEAQDCVQEAFVRAWNAAEPWTATPPPKPGCERPRTGSPSPAGAGPSWPCGSPTVASSRTPHPSPT